jgi:hypothetical protein
MSQIQPTMHREPVELDTRYISPKLRVETLLKSDGRCTHCGIRIVNGQFQADHIVRWSDGGRTEIGNLQALCLTCHSIKTRTKDTPGAAKTKRMPKACLPRDPDEIEPSQIHGRGFPKHLTKGMDGKVRPRKQRPKASQDVDALREGALQRRTTPNPTGPKP